MVTWMLVGIGVLVIAMVVAVLFGRTRETARASRMTATLAKSVSDTPVRSVEFNELVELPLPVTRYFKHVLTDGQSVIRTANLVQSGVLRTSVTADSWLPFTARQLVVPAAPGFLWNAQVGMPLGAHVRVLDSYHGGVGSGRVSLLSAIAVASTAGAPELNSGALHRYLAEAVWFPTALLPQSGVAWTPIDANAARATVTDRGTTVSLEFQFNERGEVTGIYSAGRFGRFAGEYRQVPWEGHFRDYRERQGMRIPAYGEVGWRIDGVLQWVWKGDLSDVQYEFGP